MSLCRRHGERDGLPRDADGVLCRALARRGGGAGSCALAVVSATPLLDENCDSRGSRRRGAAVWQRDRKAECLARRPRVVRGEDRHVDAGATAREVGGDSRIRSDVPVRRLAGSAVRRIDATEGAVSSGSPTEPGVVAAHSAHLELVGGTRRDRCTRRHVERRCHRCRESDSSTDQAAPNERTPVVPGSFIPLDMHFPLLVRQPVRLCRHAHPTAVGE